MSRHPDWLPRWKSSGFSRGVSKYRGVARHHHNGRWEARIGRVFGNKYLYLGTYSTQEEAAAAYDIAAIEYRGINAVTNFDLSTYIRWLRPGANNILVSPQEQQSISQNGSLASINIGQLHKESDPYLNQISLPNFMLDDLINSPYMKQEPGSTNNKLGQMPSYNNSLRRSPSSPALSLLFRSSVFRELLEKNPNASECETGQEDDKLQLRQHMENSPADEDFQGMFYDGIADHLPFLCGNNGGGDVVPGLDLEDRDGGKQCFDRPSHSIWSSILNMSSFQ